MGGDTSSVTYSSSDDECLSTINQQYLDRFNEIIFSRSGGGLSGKTTEENESVFKESDARSFQDSYNSLEIKSSERRLNNVYAQLLKKYDELKHRAISIDVAKSKILSYTPGSWIENVGGMTMNDYNLPKTTTLLLIGPKGSGKSSLINRISRVFEDDKFAPERAKVTYNSSIGNGTSLLHEYMIPKNSTSFCIYDTRSFSDDSSENLEMIKHWMTKGVSHKELDSTSLKATVKRIARQDKFVSYEKRRVNFVIFVVNGLSLLKCVESDGADTQYAQMVADVFTSSLFSFKDHETAIVITHGDLLSLSERACVRVYLGEILGVHPCKQTFDIPDNDEPTTELTIVDLVRYALTHADRNLPCKSRPLISKGRRIQLLMCLLLLLWVGMFLFIAHSLKVHGEIVPESSVEIEKGISESIPTESRDINEIIAETVSVRMKEFFDAHQSKKTFNDRDITEIISETVGVRMKEFFDVHQSKQTFDNQDNSEVTTELTFADMLRHALEHVDRNFPCKFLALISKGRTTIQLWTCLVLLFAVGQFIFFTVLLLFSSLKSQAKSVPGPSLKIKNYIAKSIPENRCHGWRRAEPSQATKKVYYTKPTRLSRVVSWICNVFRLGWLKNHRSNSRQGLWAPYSPPKGATFTFRAR